MNVRWLGWSSTQYYVTRLLMIPSIWERLNPLFSQGDSIFAQLSYKILLPQNSVWAHMTRIYSGYLSGSGTRVGLQIRLHSRFDVAAFDQVALDRILDCLQTHKVYYLNFALPFYSCYVRWPISWLLCPNESSKHSSAWSSKSHLWDSLRKLVSIDRACHCYV